MGWACPSRYGPGQGMMRCKKIQNDDSCGSSCFSGHSVSTGQWTRQRWWTVQHWLCLTLAQIKQRLIDAFYLLLFMPTRPPVFHASSDLTILTAYHNVHDVIHASLWSCRPYGCTPFTLHVCDSTSVLDIAIIKISHNSFIMIQIISRIAPITSTNPGFMAQLFVIIFLWKEQAVARMTNGIRDNLLIMDIGVY